MLKKLITVAGLAGTLGFAAPAFADWYQPAPAPGYGTGYGVPVQHPGWVADRDDWRRHEWREEWRDNDWRRREEMERYRRWRRYEWMRHHRGGYYQNW
ncbi:MAG: hypothetical protein JWM53_3118 [bacterium]|nr:hypothetical protein [bacterium]